MYHQSCAGALKNSRIN